MDSTAPPLPSHSPITTLWIRAWSYIMGKRKKKCLPKFILDVHFSIHYDSGWKGNNHGAQSSQGTGRVCIYIAGNWFHNCVIDIVQIRSVFCAYPVSILYKSTAGRYRPVIVADGPITARYRFIKNASWVAVYWSRAEYIAAGSVSSCVFWLAEYEVSTQRCIRDVPNTQLLNQYPAVYSDSGEHIDVRPIFSCMF